MLLLSPLWIHLGDLKALSHSETVFPGTFIKYPISHGVWGGGFKWRGMCGFTGRKDVTLQSVLSGGC